MGKTKKILGFLLSMILLMTHLIVLTHALDHHDTNDTHFSDTLEYQQHSDLSEDCTVCDIYLDVNFSEEKLLSYSLVLPQIISEEILQQDDQFLSFILYLKKSRSPPYFIS